MSESATPCDSEKQRAFLLPPSNMVALRILVLPGYTQNAAILSSKYGAIRKAVGGAVDFVFVDPPHVVNLPTDSSADFDSTATSNPSTPETTPRAWWFAEAKEGFRHFTKFDETLQYIRQILVTQGPFDAVWGFSQGATMSAIVAALVERPHLSPVFAKEGENWPPKPFKFAVMVAGFLPMDPKVKCFFDEKVTTPSLHILGRGDTIVGEERSLPLVARFANPRVEWHDGGHHTPSKASWRKFYKEYLDAFANGDGDDDAHRVSSPDGSATPTTAEAGGKL